MTEEKPIFIPLKTQYYEAFVSGEKKVEYRKYGNRWNKEVCRIGRKVTISKGYGKQNRRSGVIVAFGRVKFKDAPPTVSDVYPDGEPDIAAIGIKLQEAKT